MCFASVIPCPMWTHGLLIGTGQEADAANGHHDRERESSSDGTFESDMENVSILDSTPTTSHNHKNIYFRREGLGFALCICKNEAKSPVAKSCHSSHDHQAVVIDSSLNRLTGHVEPLFDVEMQRSLSLGDILLFLIEAAEATHLRKKKRQASQRVIHQTILITCIYATGVTCLYIILFNYLHVPVYKVHVFISYKTHVCKYVYVCKCVYVVVPVCAHLHM